MGTITGGTWNGSVISGAYGASGITCNPAIEGHLESGQRNLVKKR